MKYLNHFIRAVLAGLLVGIGGTVYLSCENKIVGSVLFTLALFTIVNFELNLFTGKIGYLSKSTWPVVLIAYIGNFAGANLMAFALKGTRIYPKLIAKIDSSEIVSTKLNDSLLSLFILGIFCGMLMYIAVATFKKRPDILGAIAIFMCVSVFILCGFEHCIANMYYFALGASFGEYAVPLLLVTLGNATGAITLHHLICFENKIKAE